MGELFIFGFDYIYKPNNINVISFDNIFRLNLIMFMLHFNEFKHFCIFKIFFKSYKMPVKKW